MKGLTVLGSTGSVGVSTLDVVRRNPDRFQVQALTAHRSLPLLVEQCAEFRPRLAVAADPDGAGELAERLRAAGVAAEVAAGPEGLEAAATWRDSDYVMAAIVGAAGLTPTLAAARSGRRVLLANKESAVMAGPLLMAAVRDNGAELVPIDSEHNAVFQCLPRGAGGMEGVLRIILTASGGPFLDVPAEALANVSPDQACAHPNWEMGRKISVDSATMMNKGLEIIEACHLFGVAPSRVDVVVHPQSIVHSMVEYADGSVLAQLGNPDMRTPIAHALGWPARIDSGVASLDLVSGPDLEFRAPDLERFPCLRLARQAAEAGGSSPIWLNAVNEVAVAEFLDGRIPFTAIPSLIDTVLAQCPAAEAGTLDAVLAADREARRTAGEHLPRFRL